MNHRPLGPDGPLVSSIGLGGMYLSITGRPDEADAIRTIHAALDAGVTLIDTADVYCLDERDIGHNERLVAQGPRRPPRARHRRDQGWPPRAPAAPGRATRAPSISPPRARPASAALGVAAHRRLPAPRARLGRALRRQRRRARAPARAGEDRPRRPLQRQRRASSPRRGASSPSPACRTAGTRAIAGPSATASSRPARRRASLSSPTRPSAARTGRSTLGDRKRLAAEANRRGMSPHRLVLAWMLARSPVVIPIPGARREASTRDSAAAAEVKLSATDVAAIEAAF